VVGGLVTKPTYSYGVWVTLDADKIEGRTARITNLIAGLRYEFRVRTNEGDGKISDWVTQKSDGTVNFQEIGIVGKYGNAKGTEKKLSGIKATKKTDTIPPTANAVILMGFGTGAKLEDYIITFGKLPSGVTEASLSDVKFSMDANGNLTVIGLPSGKTFAFTIQKIDGSGKITMPLTVRAATVKIAAERFKTDRNATGLNGVAFSISGNPAAMPAGTTNLQYEITVSYVMGKSRDKVTHTATLIFDKIDDSTGTAYLNGVLVTATLLTGNRIEITGLPAAGTKYTFGVKTVGILDGALVTSLESKISITTAKYDTIKVSLNKKTGVVTWNLSKFDGKPGHDYYGFVFMSGYDFVSPSGAATMTLNVTRGEITSEYGTINTKGKVTMNLTQLFALAVSKGIAVTDLETQITATGQLTVASTAISSVVKGEGVYKSKTTTKTFKLS